MKAELAGEVFVNCPFDSLYRPLFRAIVFAVHDCGFVARSALEVADSADPRLTKILRLIGSCRFGIHDISRTELDPVTGLPRYHRVMTSVDEQRSDLRGECSTNSRTHTA